MQRVQLQLTGYPAPFGNYYQGALNQVLIKASELTAAGLHAGNITSIAFDVVTPVTTALSGFNIGIKQTSINSLSSSALETGLTTVFSVSSYTPSSTAGYTANTINFTTPFNWDGTSNLVIQTCFANTSFTTNAIFKQTATSYLSTLVYRADLTTVCSSPAAPTFTYNQRPNIQLGGQVNTTGPGSYQWTWNPGALTGATVTVNPQQTTSYTVTATDAAGCSTQSAPVTVTTSPVTATATSTTTSAVCAGTAVTLNGVAGGGGPFTYSWSNGTSVVGSTASISVSPTATTMYTLTVTDNCGNTATADITINVTALPTSAIVEQGPFTLCAPSSQVLTASTNAVNPSYQWLLNGNVIPTAVSVNYTATTTGQYSVKVTESATGCTSNASASTQVTINPQPSFTVAPTTSTVCNGSIVTLNGVINTTLGTSASTTVGNTTASTLGPNPFQNYYGGTKQQMLFTADELKSIGMSAGSVLSGIKFNLVTANTTYALINLRIKIKATTTTSLLDWEPGTTIVRGTANYTPTVGINTLTFGTTFTWDGASNVVIELNYSNNNAGATGTFNTAKYSPTSFQSTLFYREDNATPASLNSYTGAASFAYNSRNDVGFDYSNPPGISWTPTTGLFTNAAATTAYTVDLYTVYAKPAVSTTYVANLTNSLGCSSTKNAVVNINQRPTAVISGSGTYCTGGITGATLSIAVTGNGPWSGTLSNGQAFNGSTSPITITVAPNTTTTYSVATLNDTKCTAIAADFSGSATVTVNSRPTAAITGSGTYCAGSVSATSLSIAVTGSCPWNGTLSDGTVFSGSTSPISVSVTPSSTTTYTVASLTDANCTSIAADFTGSATVTVNNRPTAVITGSGIILYWVT